MNEEVRSQRPDSRAPAPAQPAEPAAPVPGSRRWLVLAVVGVAQLMVVLDATIVNIALPSAQRALGFGIADRQWVITAYALAFGGLLIVGGRLGDLLGRKRTFVAGLVGFAVASAVGGAAPDFAALVAARAVQGAFAALLAPSALALLITTFTDIRERGKALGIYTAIAGGGGAIGLILGGVLTEYLSWRWCLYVNVAFAAVALAGAVPLIRNQPRNPGSKAGRAGQFAGRRRPGRDRVRLQPGRGRRLGQRVSGRPDRPRGSSCWPPLRAWSGGSPVRWYRWASSPTGPAAPPTSAPSSAESA